VSAIPENFVEMSPFGPFHELVGPLYTRIQDGTYTLGFHMQHKHRNLGDMMHGGMVCMVVDTVLTWAASKVRNGDGMALTTSLSVDLMGQVREGDWVEARVNFMRPGRRIVFAECYLWVNDKAVARGNAQFQVVGAKGTAAG